MIRSAAPPDDSNRRNDCCSPDRPYDNGYGVTASMSNTASICTIPTANWNGVPIAPAYGGPRRLPRVVAHVLATTRFAFRPEP